MLALVLIVLMVSVSAYIVYARKLPSITGNQRTAFKTMLKNYFHPVLHGYGIGFTADTYVTAKWHITNVRILATNRIKNIISGSNTTDWSQVRAEIQNALQDEGTLIKKGRIRIGKTNYLLTNIEVSNSTASADIKTIPNYTACKKVNTSAEDCENNSEKVGDITVTKKTNAIEEATADPRVWGGILNFNNIEYTFVTFAYPRW